MIHLKKQILKALQLDENHERECKLAQGGLPESIWEKQQKSVDTKQNLRQEKL